VNDAFLVGGLDGLGQCGDELGRLARRQRLGGSRVESGPPSTNSSEKNGCPSCSPTS
jgi:hypothetical protein